MDEGRYGQVRKLEDRHRKFVCIINDILKSRTEVYESCLTREQYESSFRYVKNTMTVRKALVRQKVLQKCLEMRRRGNEGKTGLFGRYDGVPIHSMSRDVEAYIASRHPKVRRIQKVQRLLKESIDNGAILDDVGMTDKIEQFFRKKIDSMETRQREKASRHRTVGGENMHLDSVDRKPLREDNKLRLHVPQMQKDIGKQKASVTGQSEEILVLERKRTLILPPITPNKALIQH